MSKVKITKIGLLNFWLYDEEEYDFYGGNLILRGANGTGKSVTMQSFIPLILDGNKSPERLDPFGSKERKIEDYILGDSESGQKEEATSYLYMETLNVLENKYITIGLGFRGRKGKGVESWGFALKDGKRIRKDFFLYKDSTNKIPLSKNELKSRLGSINEFADTMKEYKAMVNRLLFGFPNIEMYDEFIKLLLQLRSNKLSKDYKPTHLIEVLNSVLQPLSEEDLRPLSEAIEQMNKTKETIETLEKNSKALNEFMKTYNNYNEIVLITKARNFYNTNNSYIELSNNINALSLQLNDLEKKLESKSNRYKEVIEQIEVNKQQKKNLDNQDLKQKIESLSDLNNVISSLELKIKELGDTLEKNKEDELDLNKKIAKIEDEIYTVEKEIKSILIDLKDLGNNSYFDEITFFSDEVVENLDKDISFESIFMSLRRYSEKVNMLISLLQKEEQILMQSQSMRLEFEKLTNEYNRLEKDIINQDKNLKESIMAWEEDFINKVNNNKYLILEEGYKKQIFNLMNDYSSNNYEESKSLYKTIATDLINSITSNNLVLESKKNKLNEELKSRQIEYQKIKDNDEIDYPSLNDKTDKLLNDNNIEFIPLYKCIEFKDNLSDLEKNRIESTLIDLNILNAKIVNETDIDKIEKLNTEVLYLTKSTKKKNNLLKYFDVVINSTSSIKEDYVKDILSSISTDKNDLVSIGNDGYSKFDFLNSISDSSYQANYIGYLKRKELREKILKELEDNIDTLTSQISNITNLILENNNTISIIESESHNFPSNELINKITDKQKELSFALNYNDKKQKELEIELSSIDKELNAVKDLINENKKGMHIPLNLNTYKEVSITILSIKELLQNVKVSHTSYLKNIEIKESFKERLEIIENNITYLNDEVFEKEKDLKVNIATRTSINELLETKEYKDLKEGLINIEESISSLEKEKEDLIREKSRHEKDIEYSEEKYSNLSNDLDTLVKKLNIYKEIFIREYNLHYLYKDDYKDILEIAKKIVKDGSSKKEISLNDSLSKFYESFNHYRLELNDYSLKNVSLFDDYSTDNVDDKTLYEDGVRVDIEAMYQGQKMNIISLDTRLKSDIEENKEIISSQDRHLFEDILLNTVGDKIRKRIDSSFDWIEKINKIMKVMQQDSALSFKLVWKSISAESDGEVDTKELVKMLKMDPKLLKESDVEKITNHFRSKIKKAEELYSDSYTAFYKIIEDILDYRKWFSFNLEYKRASLDYKELTDKIFSKFSGGERAKSMYIPLFASCYTKLNLARDDSLRTIALDEAFAGVDEENIREMFGILKYLDLNFIINSQALWGDYDTVDDLSICEIIRPNNSSVVSVERYRWNGKYKEIINDRLDYDA